jgi:hypothetical protein
MTFHIVRAQNRADIAAAATLFREYADWLGIDLIPIPHQSDFAIYGKDEMDLTILGLRSM